MVEILPGIFMITEKGLFPQLKPEVRIYVIAGTQGLVFDGGYGNRKAVRQFNRELAEIRELCSSRGMPCNVERILPSHSHPDHFSGVAGIARTAGMNILLTGKMAARITSGHKFRSAYPDHNAYRDRLYVPRILKFASRLVRPLILRYYRRIFGIQFVEGTYTEIPERGEIIINGKPWIVFPSPGHCDDHVSLYDPERGILFAGDNVLRSITTWLGPPDSDIKKYLASLQEILDLPDLQLILPAHGRAVDSPKERIRELMQWRAARTGHVMEIISAHPAGITMREILKLLYPKRQMVKRFLAEGWIDITIRYLEDEGKIVKGKRGNRFVFLPR